MAESYSVEAVLSLVDQGFKQGMAQAAAQAQKLQAQIDKMTSGEAALDKLSRGAKTIGTAMMGAGVAVTAMGVKSATGFGTFQQSLNKAAVVAGGTAKDIDGLAEVANKMGADLPLSAQDAADAMVEMAGAGASVGKIKAIFPAIAQAATATGDDLQATASVVQNAMNIWGDSLASPSQAAAILTETANLSNASISDMQQALATIGGTASNAGLSMQDITEAIGLLTNKGFSAAQASQDLNHAIVQMQAPSSIAAGEMDSLGLSFNDSTGKMKPMKQILTDVAKAMDGLKPEERTASLKRMFGTAGMAAIIPLLSNVKNKTDDTANSWDAYAKTMGKATKDAATSSKYLSDQANEMQQNMGSKIKQVGGNWEALSNKAMAAKGGVTGAFLDMTNGVLQWAAESNSGIAKITRSFIGLAPVVGPALTAIGGIASQLGPITKFAGSAVKAFGNMYQSVSKLTARLLGIGAAGKTAGAGEKAAGEGARVSAKEMIAFGAAVLEIGAGIALAVAGFAALVLAITKLAKTGTSGLVALVAVTAAISGLAAVFTLLGPALTASALGIGVFGASVLAIGTGIGLATSGIALLLTSITALGANMTMIIPTLTAVGVGFASMITSFITVLATNAPVISAGILNIVTSMLQTLVTAIPQFVTVGMQLVLGILQGISSNIGQITAKALEIVVNFINGVASKIGDVITAAVNLIVNFVDGLAKSVPKVIPAAVKLIVQFVTSIADNLDKIINAAVDLISKFILGLVKAIPEIADNGMQAVEKFVYGVGYAIGKVLTSGKKLIAQFIKGIISGVSGSHSAGKKNADAIIKVVRSVNLLDIGANIVKGLASGITGAAHHVWDAISSITSAIPAKLRKWLGIHSPSRVIRDRVGQWIPRGLAVGIENGRGIVEKSAAAIADAAIPQLSIRSITSSISGMASAISDAMNVTGSINMASQINQVNGQLQRSLNASVAQNISVDKQPANITLVMGGADYSAYVDDLSTQQAQKTQLKRKYTLREV